MWKFFTKPFTKTTGWRCANIACDRKGEPVSGDGVCEACRQAPAPVVRPDWPRLGAAAAGVVLLLFGCWYGAHGYLTRRAAERQALVLAQASDRFQEALRGATSVEVEAIAGQVQTEFKLSSRQRRRVLERFRTEIDRLPNPLTPEEARQLDKLLRTLPRQPGGALSPEGRAELDAVARRRRLSPQALLAMDADVSRRLEGVSRSLARGQSLIGQAKVAEARLEFVEATRSDPANANAWANLGAADMLLGQSREALDCYDKALALDSRNWLAHYNLGLFSARRGDREAAFGHLRQALGALPAASRERREVIRELLADPDLAAVRQGVRFAGLLGGELGAAPGGKQ